MGVEIMPNSWAHHQPSSDTTCIAPLVAPYGRYNVDEIAWAGLPAVILITAWRIIFCYIFSPYLGGYVASKNYPNPHPKPAFISMECNASKVKKLHSFYTQIEAKKSKIPKTKKKTESEQKRFESKISANIK